MGRKRFVARLFDVLEGKTDEAAICWRASLHAREPGAEDDPSLDATLAAPPHAVVVRSKQRLVANVLPMLSCSANFDNFRRQLSHYGFSRVGGPRVIAFVHRSFRPGRADMLMFVTPRLPRRGDPPTYHARAQLADASPTDPAAPAAPAVPVLALPPTWRNGRAPAAAHRTPSSESSPMESVMRLASSLSFTRLAPRAAGGSARVGDHIAARSTASREDGPPTGGEIAERARHPGSGSRSQSDIAYPDNFAISSASPAVDAPPTGAVPPLLRALRGAFVEDMLWLGARHPGLARAALEAIAAVSVTAGGDDAAEAAALERT